MQINITIEDYERWIGQLYISNKQLEKALMAIDKEEEKGVEIIKQEATDDKDKK